MLEKGFEQKSQEAESEREVMLKNCNVVLNKVVDK